MTSATGFGMSQVGYSSSMQRPDPSKMADKMFSKVDANSDGNITKDEMQTVFDQTSSDGTASGTSTSASSIDDVFKALDSNGDNLLTKQEMTESLQKLTAEFESQAGSTAMGGMPPPPPMGGMGPSGGEGDSDGLSKDDLTAAASSLTTLSENFEAADTNSDGKVSFEEAQAYQEKTTSSSTTSATSSSVASSSESQSSASAMMRKIGELLRAAYGSGANQDSSLSSATNSLSITV